MPALRIKNLTKRYNGINVLDHLHLEVEEGEIVTIAGKSGSGKTTLLLCILGFIQQDRGEIILHRQPIHKFPIEERQLGYVPQDYGLFPHLTVEENITFGLVIREEPLIAQKQAVQELLALVRIPPHFAQRQVIDLSGGEKQRVALARALAIKPNLFLLDEPLSAIDPETKKGVAQELRNLIKKTKIPAIIITHDSQDAKSLGDHRYKLEKGKLRRLS